MVATKVPEEARTKRDAILRAARTLFAKKSYEETTIADIAREAGIAVGTVYLYFRNKRDIYTAVALDIESLVADAFRDPELLNLPFERVPRILVDELFRISREHKSLMALLQIDMQSAEEVKQHEHSHQQVNATLDMIFRHAIEKGELAPFNTALYAQMLIHFGSDVMHQCFGVENGAREDLYYAYLLEFIERLFFGPSLRDGYKDQKPGQGEK
ncbi:MAG: hypothetical protein NVS2B12_36920 [Ktedonobacteraceae bacterium]